MTVKKKPVVIVGGSGHAKVLIDCFVESERKIIGIVDPALEKGITVSGIKVLGGDEVLESISNKDVELVNGIGALPGKMRRWQVAADLEKKHYQFAIVVHPSAIVSRSVRLEAGAQIMAGSVIQTGVRVGRQSVVNSSVSVDHDSVIEHDCWLSPGVTVCADAHIGVGAYIGAGATIIQNVFVGEGTLVRAGSSVVCDIRNSI